MSAVGPPLSCPNRISRCIPSIASRIPHFLGGVGVGADIESDSQAGAGQGRAWGNTNLKPPSHCTGTQPTAYLGHSSATQQTRLIHIHIHMQPPPLPPPPGQGNYGLVVLSSRPRRPRPSHRNPPNSPGPSPDPPFRNWALLRCATAGAEMRASQKPPTRATRRRWLARNVSGLPTSRAAAAR